MANSIALAKKYAPILDEIYAYGALTSILENDVFVREGAGANEVLIPNVTLQGLANYSKGSGFVAGDVTFAWETHQLTQDRGRTFTIDAMDNEETLDLAIASTVGQFVRTKVTAEVDAYRFAKLASLAGNSAEATLSASDALQAYDTACKVMGDAEVDLSACVIFVSFEVYNYFKQSSLVSRQVMANVGPMAINREIETLDGHPLVRVPSTRFNTEVTLLTGGSGQEAGGYTASGVDINFLIVDTNAVMGVKKHVKPRLFAPDVNQDADAWKFDYRIYHDLIVPDNKVDGIYLHSKVSGS